MSILNERQKKEVDLINKNQFMTIKQLASVFEVSEMTVRRDISILLEQGLVNQVYGGVIGTSQSEQSNEYYISREVTKNTEKKQNICRKAVELIAPGDVVYLDSGTTIRKLAEDIPESKHLTIITSNYSAFPVITRLPNCRLITPGGVFAPKQEVFYQNNFAEQVENYRVNKCFIGATGYDIKFGLTCSFPEDVDAKKTMLELSQEKILLLDSSKYNKVSTCVFGEIDDFTTVITDNGIPDIYIKHIRDKGIRLIIV